MLALIFILVMVGLVYLAQTEPRPSAGAGSWSDCVERRLLRGVVPPDLR